jgi:aryl-alcohol dehydrogenase-like predicted oxidoreductase
MKYTNLGNSGLSVSRLCLGMMTYGSTHWRDWTLDYDESKPFVKRALESGINFFDTADMYSNGASEEVLGRALKEFGVDRHDVVIASKCFFGTHSQARNRWGLSRKNVIESCDASLERLGTDFIDLYQIHRFDPDTPIEETIDALDSLVVAGKVRYLGASSMFAWQMAKYLYTQRERGTGRFVSMQNHYNLLYREEEREMNPLCADQGVGLIPWSPMARGYLARTPETQPDTVRAKSDEVTRTLYPTPDAKVVARNAETAARLGVAPAQTALAWLLSKHGVTAPIIGISKPRQLDEAVGSLDVELSDDDIKGLEEFYEPHAISGHS